MSRFLHLLLAFSTFFLAAIAAPVVTVEPGDATHGLKITKENTVNATAPAPITNGTRFRVNAVNGQLPLSFVNNFPGGAINAYVTGLDSSNRLVLLKSDGTFYYPSATNSGVPQEITENCAIPLGGQGSTTQITTPGYISSARIWFAEGTLKFYVVQGGSGPSLVEPSAVNPNDPSASVNWGFVELTYNSGGLYANISYVDFLGLILGMSLTGSDGSTQGARGLKTGSVQSVCQALQAQQQQDGFPWGDLCQADSNGNMLRVLAPTDYISAQNSAFSTYWNSYVDQVWSTYSSQPLYINTQGSAGTVSCQVSGDQLQCAGDNRGYSKPTASDIFGCNSGPFAIQGGDNGVHAAVVPRLCAAFHRSTLLLSGGNTQPSLDSSHYYGQEPTNYYSKFIHQYELDGKGYAFSYDDVNPDGENQSGTVATGNPQLLTIYIGGNQ